MIPTLAAFMAAVTFVLVGAGVYMALGRRLRIF